MAGKKGGKGDDIDFDDDFPDFPGDMGDSGFDGMEPKDDRSPVMKVAGGFREGLTSHIKDPKNQVKFIKNVLPEGYGRAIDITDESMSIASELYDHALKEAKPVVSDVKKILKILVPKESAFLPKKWTDAIHSALEESPRTPSQEEMEETAIGQAMGEVFKVQAEKQDAMYEDQKQREDIRTAVQVKGNASIVQQLAAIRIASERMVGYQDSVNAGYQRKSLELQFRSYFVQRRQLDEFQKYSQKAHAQLDVIVKNTGLPESVKIHNSELAADLIKRRMFDNISQWTSGIGRRLLQNSKVEISNFFQSVGGLASMAVFGAESAKEMAAAMPGGLHGMAGQSLGGTAAEWLVNKAIAPVSNKLRKNDTVMRGNFILQNLLGLAPQKFSDWLSNPFESFLPEYMQGGGLSSVEEFAKKLFGPGYRRDTSLGTLEGDQELDKASHITNLTRRTIEEVIPGWLSKIHRELAVIRTGDNSLVPIEYNFSNRKFQTVEEKADAISKEIFDQYKLEGLDKAVESIIKVIDDGQELSPSTREVLKESLLKDLLNERAFDPGKYANHPDDELATFIREKYQIEQIDEFTGKTKISTSRENQENIQKAMLLTKYAQHYVPDIRDLGKRSLKAGNISAFERLGLVDRRDNEYYINEEAYIEALRDPTKRAQLNLGQGQYNQIAPFIGGGMMGPHPQLQPQPMPNIPQPTPTVPERSMEEECCDKLQEAIEKMKEGIVQALIDNSSKTLTAGSNQLLAVIVQMLKEGIAIGQATAGAGSPPAKMHWADRAIHGVLDLGKGIKDYAVGSIKFGNRMAGKAWGALGKVGGFIKDQGKKLLDYYDETDFRDVYIRGKEKVMMKARDIKLGEYIDTKTGKIITSPKDITGEVKDKAGNIIISAEEYAEGLYDRNGKPLIASIGNLIGKGIKGIGNMFTSGNRMITNVTSFLKNTATMAIRFAKMHTDVYVKGETTPRLFARVMRQGGYLHKKTGKPITDVSDIADDVTDLHGNILLTAAEIAKPGIVDKEGNPIESLGAKVFGLGTKALGYAKDQIVKGGKKVWEMANKGWTWLKNAGKGMYNQITGGGGIDFQMFGGSSRPVVAAVKALYHMLNRRLPGTQESDGEIEAIFNKIISQRAMSMPTLNGLGINTKAIGERLKGMGANLKDKFTEWRAKLVGTAIGAAPDIMIKYEKLKAKLKEKFNLTQERANSLVEELKSRYGNNYREAENTAMGLKAKLMGSIAVGMMKLGSFFKPSATEVIGEPSIREGSQADSVRDEAAREAAERQEEAVEQRRESMDIMRKIYGLFVKNDKREEVRDEEAEDEEAEDEEAEDDEGGGGSLIGTILEKIGLGWVKKTMGGIWDKISGAAEDAAIGTIVGNIVTKIGEKISNSAVGKAATALGRSAISYGGMAVNGLMGAAGAGISSAVGLAGTALSGLAALVFSPIGLAVGAVAAAVYGGIKLYKSFSKRDQYLSKFRYVQYGFDPGSSWRDGDDSEIETITKLEEFLIPHVENRKGAASRINPGQITVEQMVDIFGIDKEDPEEVNHWVQWFAHRFRPVFLSHMTVMTDIGKGKVKLNEIDDRFSTEERKEYLKRVHFPLDSGPYTVPNSPFPHSWYEVYDNLFGEQALDMEPEEVQEYYEEYMSDIEDARSGDADKALARHDGTKEGEAKKAALTAEANKPWYQKTAEFAFKWSGLKLAFDTGKKIGGWINELIADSKDYGVGLSGMLGITSPGGKAFLAIAALPVALAKMALAGIGIGADKRKFITDKANRLNKFRMYQYGYSPSDSFDFVEKILLLEEGLFPYIQNGAGGATLAGNLPVEELFKIFDIDEDDDEDIHRFSEWFQRRFKPIFLSHVTVLNSITTGVNIHQADVKLNPQQKLDYLKRVHFQLTDGPYTYMLSPFPHSWYELYDNLFGSDEVDIEPSDIDYIYKAITKEIQATVKASPEAASKTDEYIGKGSEAKTLNKEMEKKKIDDEKAKKDKEKKASDKKEALVKKQDKEKSWLDILKEKSGNVWDAVKGTGSNMLKMAGGAVSGAVSAIGDAARKYASPLAELGSYIGKTAANWKPLKGNAKKNEQIMIDHALAAGITNPKELAMLLGQIHEETGFYAMEENLRYRPQPLMDTFKAVRKRGLAFATELSKLGPETIANFIYADENRDKSRKLGNVEPGDGWKYRGRGFLQITGRGNYEHHGKRLGIDLINNPDLAADPHVAAELAIDFWKSRVGSKLGGSGDVKAVTGVVNGVATMRLQERIDGYNMYMDKIAKGEIKASGDAVQKLAGKGSGSAEDAKTTPDQAPPPAAPKKDDTKPTVAAATPSASPKTAAANAAIAAASPAAVTTAAPKVTPAPAASTPGVVPVSTGAALNVAASKQREAASQAQTATQRTAEVALSGDKLDKVASILTAQLETQISMDTSLKSIAILLTNGVGQMPNAADAKTGGKVASNSRRDNPPPSAGAKPPMNMGRS